MELLSGDPLPPTACFKSKLVITRLRAQGTHFEICKRACVSNTRVDTHVVYHRFNAGEIGHQSSSLVITR